MNKKVLSLGLGFCLATFFVACGSDSGTNGNENSGDNGYSYEKSSEGFLKMGSMVDPRNDKTYKTILVGDQLWMAEDLEFVNPAWQNYAQNGTSTSYSNIDVVAYPALAGLVNSVQTEEVDPSRGYTYDQAMNYNTFMDSAYNDGMCPPGWHLPTMAEYDVFWGVVSTMCDSVSYCSLGEKMWNQAKYYWTSTPANGIRINTEHGYKYESNSNTAVCYKVDFSDRKPVEADFAGKSSLMAVRCVKGSEEDSATALKKYLKIRDETIEYLSSSAAYQAYLSSSSAAEWARIQQGAKKYFNPDLNYGEFVDPRDGQTYGYLQIGNYTWMAENMKVDLTDFFSYKCISALLTCRYPTREDSIAYYEHGLAYSDSLLDQVCPSGWHVPSKAEWEDLFSVDSNAGSYLATDGNWPAGDGLFNKNEITNSTGFTAIATDGAQTRFNETYFWTSTDSLEVSIKIDTVYVDSLLPVDSVALADTILTDTNVVEPIPERTFVFDTTRIETKHHVYVEYDWMINNFQFTTKLDRRSLFVRCVMDY